MCGGMWEYYKKNSQMYPKNVQKNPINGVFKWELDQVKSLLLGKDAEKWEIRAWGEQPEEWHFLRLRKPQQLGNLWSRGCAVWLKSL